MTQLRLAPEEERNRANAPVAVEGVWWPSVQWRLSLLIPLAMLLWGISLMVAPGEPDLLIISVESQVTGERLPDARVRVGNISYRTDDRGEITVEPVSAGIALEASADGHESLRREVPEPGHGNVTVSLPGVLVYGTVVDALSDRPVAGADVTVVDADGASVATAHTDEFGSFIFKFIPEDAFLNIDDEVYGESIHALREQRTLLIPLDPPPVTGRVVDQEGESLAGVVVTHATASTTTDGGGRFILTDVGQGAEVALAYDGLTSTVVIEGSDMGDIVLGAPVIPSATTEDRSG